MSQNSFSLLSPSDPQAFPSVQRKASICGSSNYVSEIKSVEIFILLICTLFHPAALSSLGDWGAHPPWLDGIMAVGWYWSLCSGGARCQIANPQGGRRKNRSSVPKRGPTGVDDDDDGTGPPLHVLSNAIEWFVVALSATDWTGWWWLHPRGCDFTTDFCGERASARDCTTAHSSVVTAGCNVC